MLAGPRLESGDNRAYAFCGADEIYLYLSGSLRGQLANIGLNDELGGVGGLHLEYHALVGSVEQVNVCCGPTLGIKFLAEVDIWGVDRHLTLPVLLV